MQMLHLAQAAAWPRCFLLQWSLQAARRFPANGGSSVGAAAAALGVGS